MSEEALNSDRPGQARPLVKVDIPKEEVEGPEQPPLVAGTRDVEAPAVAPNDDIDREETFDDAPPHSDRPSTREHAAEASRPAGKSTISVDPEQAPVPDAAED